ncbi:MAG: histidine kinase [Bacteroidota bacterium]
MPKRQLPIPNIPLTNTQLLVVANLFFWVTLGVFDVLTTGGFFNGYFSVMVWRYIFHIPLFAMLIYPNLYFLYPRFFSRQKYVQYILFALGLLGIVLFLRIALDNILLSYFFDEGGFKQGMLAYLYEEKLVIGAENKIVESGFYNKDSQLLTSVHNLGMLVGTIGVFFITTPIKLVEDWYTKQRLELNILQHELDKNSAEIKAQEEKIKFLKAQTDPHFLINSISGVYNLALLQSDKVETALLRMSELMSYLLGHGKKDAISLQYEIEFIEHFLDFHKLIEMDELNISFTHNLSRAELRTIEIPPMLLQPFFENGIKHGHLGEYEGSYLHSSLEIVDGYLHFFAENSLPSHGGRLRPKPSTGTGMTNLQERLAHYLPDRYKLDIEQSTQWYRVNLRLALKGIEPRSNSSAADKEVPTNRRIPKP